MNKIQFRKGEVLSYLEEILRDGTATDEQEELYSTYKWSGKLEKGIVLKSTLKEMRQLWEIKF